MVHIVIMLVVVAQRRHVLLRDVSICGVGKSRCAGDIAHGGVVWSTRSVT